MMAYERAKTIRANVKAAGRCDVPRSARAVLKVLAEYANPDGTSAHPSVATLAQQASRSVKTVQRWLRWLIEEGYIWECGINRRYRTVEYALDLDMIWDNPLPRPRKRVWCPAWLRREVIQGFGEWCPYCLETGDDEIGPDCKPWHIIMCVSTERGGVYNEWNVSLCCDTCNRRRHPTHVDWFCSLGYVREEDLDRCQAGVPKWPGHPRQNGVAEPRQNGVAEGVKDDVGANVEDDPINNVKDDPQPTLVTPTKEAPGEDYEEPYETQEAADILG